MLGVVPLCCLQFAMLLVVEFRDATGDAAVGKRTLVVWLAGARAAQLHGAVAVTAPLALWQGWRMRCGVWADPVRWNSLGFWSVALLIGTAVVELLAFLA